MTPIVPEAEIDSNRISRSPTNRGNSTPLSGPESSPALIDTIRLAWQVKEQAFSRQHMVRLADERTGEVRDLFMSATSKIDGRLLRVKTTMRGLEASLECSLP